MPKPDSLQGSLDLLVLKILSRRPRSHGYAIMTAIQNMSGEVLRKRRNLRLHVRNTVRSWHLSGSSCGAS